MTIPLYWISPPNIIDGRNVPQHKLLDLNIWKRICKISERETFVYFSTVGEYMSSSAVGPFHITKQEAKDYVASLPRP